MKSAGKPRNAPNNATENLAFVLDSRSLTKSAQAQILQLQRFLPSGATVVDIASTNASNATNLAGFHRLVVCGSSEVALRVLRDVTEAAEEAAGTTAPAVGIIPLGASNDLATTLGWGEPHLSHTAVQKYCESLAAASQALLDRWKVSVIPADSITEEADPFPSAFSRKECALLGTRPPPLPKFSRAHSWIESDPREFVLREHAEKIWRTLHVDVAKTRTQVPVLIRSEDSIPLSQHQAFQPQADATSDRSCDSKDAELINPTGNASVATRPVETLHPAPLGDDAAQWTTFDATFFQYFICGIGGAVAFVNHRPTIDEPADLRQLLRHELMQNRLQALQSCCFGCCVQYPECAGLRDCATLQIRHPGMLDFETVDIPSGVKGLIISNVQTYAGEVTVWGNKQKAAHPTSTQSDSSRLIVSKSERAWAIPSVSDGMLEIVGISGARHGLRLLRCPKFASQTIKIAQACEIRMSTQVAMPMQIDGDHWVQRPCTIQIHHGGGASVLVHNSA